MRDMDRYIIGFFVGFMTATLIAIGYLVWLYTAIKA